MHINFKMKDIIHTLEEEDEGKILIKGERLPPTISQTNQLARRGSKSKASDEYFMYHAREVNLETPYNTYR